jgi:hypothetical protein
MKYWNAIYTYVDKMVRKIYQKCDFKNDKYLINFISMLESKLLLDSKDTIKGIRELIFLFTEIIFRGTALHTVYYKLLIFR